MCAFLRTPDTNLNAKTEGHGASIDRPEATCVCVVVPSMKLREGFPVGALPVCFIYSCSPDVGSLSSDLAVPSVPFP